MRAPEDRREHLRGDQTVQGALQEVPQGLGQRLQGQEKGARQMTLPPTPCTLLQAIAREEGFYAEGPPNRPQRCNNPGDLEWHPWMKAFGAMAGDPRFAVFPTADQGFAALRHLLQLPLYSGKTIAQAIWQFAPGNENNTQSYIRNVCAWCEQQQDAVIDGLLG